MAPHSQHAKDDHEDISCIGFVDLAFQLHIWITTYRKRRTHPTIFPIFGPQLNSLFFQAKKTNTKPDCKKNGGKIPAIFFGSSRWNIWHGSQLEFILDLSLPASQPRHHLAISDPRNVSWVPFVVIKCPADVSPNLILTSQITWWTTWRTQKVTVNGEMHPHLRNLSTSHLMQSPKVLRKKKHHKNWS